MVRYAAGLYHLVLRQLFTRSSLSQRIRQSALIWCNKRRTLGKGLATIRAPIAPVIVHIRHVRIQLLQSLAVIIINQHMCRSARWTYLLFLGQMELYLLIRLHFDAVLGKIVDIVHKLICVHNPSSSQKNKCHVDT